MKQKSNIKTDVSKQYLIDLCLKDDPYKTTNVICNVKEGDGCIVATAAEDADLFETHRYYDNFFQWLLYCGKIKVYDNAEK